MTTETLRRPEVHLGECPHDGGPLLRQYGRPGHVWRCAVCGRETTDETSDEVPAA